MSFLTALGIFGFGLDTPLPATSGFLFKVAEIGLFVFPLTWKLFFTALETLFFVALERLDMLDFVLATLSDRGLAIDTFEIECFGKGSFLLYFFRFKSRSCGK